MADANKSKTQRQFPLSRRKIIKKTLTKILPVAWFVLIICVIVPLIAADKIFPDVHVIATAVKMIGGGGSLLFLMAGLALLAVVLVLLTYLYQLWYFNAYFYDLNASHVVIKKGPITPHEITVPYERIQDVYVDQDIFDRIFNIYDVHISSATATSGLQAHIDGVAKDAADGLRAMLLAEMNKRMKSK